MGNKEYIPQHGEDLFRTLVPKLILGEKYEHLIKENKVATVQSLSGTGALRLGFAFLNKFLPKDTLYYLPNPTWGNHNKVLDHSGIEESRVKTYDYYDKKTRGLNLKGILKSLSEAPEHSVVILHLCAHNPTGVDPTDEEWKEIGSVCKKKNMIVFFDNAYQGFATGDLDKDAYALQYFLSLGLEIICAQSFAKNFGLYGERVGSINFIVNDSSVAKAIVTQMDIIVRGMYSSPPLHGARLVTTVLSDKKLYQMWLDDLKVMSSRILQMRKALHAKLIELKTPGDWSHVVNQIGMFTFTGLDKEQSEKMVKKHHIYMLSNGRISMSGLNEGNVEYVAKSIYDVIVNK